MKRIPPVRPLAMVVCGLGILAAACGDDTLQPPAPVAHVSLALRVERATGWWPDSPYVITATVTNDGDLPVHWYASGCDGLTSVRGPDDLVVQVRRPRPCPQSFLLEHLAPGEVLTESYSFTGILYNTNAEPVDAPPGTYTVNAGFQWFAEDREDWRNELSRQTFDWPARPVL